MHWRARSSFSLSRFLRSLLHSFLHSLHVRFHIGSSAADVGLILAYGCSAFSIAIINNIWVTYNYPFFVSGILSDSYYFLIVQSLFLVWNSLNDPLFGWLSDQGSMTTDDPHDGQRKGHPALRRIKHIRYGGYGLGAAFLFAWFPWSTSSCPLAALHFLLSLCLYDGALTYMEVNYSSLLADLSSNAQTRAWCNSAAISCRVVESWARRHATTQHVSLEQSNAKVEMQQIATKETNNEKTTTIVHVRAYSTQENEANQTASTPSSAIIDLAPSSPSPPASPSSSQSSSSTSSAPSLTFRLFIRQLLSHRNFSLFCLIRFLQVFLCTFEKNHLSSFLDAFFSDGDSIDTTAAASSSSAPSNSHAIIGRSSRGLLISLSFLLPHLLLVLTSLYAAELGGVYQTIRKLLFTKVAAATTMGIAVAYTMAGGGASTIFTSSSVLPYLLILYLCGGRVLTECVCRMFPLVVSNLVDEDRMAATLIGTSALLAKPGESLAPMLGWKVLHILSAAPSMDTNTAMDGGAAAMTLVRDSRKQALLILLLTLPLVTVSAQLIAWSFFTLKGSHLKQITQQVKEMEEDGEEEDQQQRQKEQEEEEENSRQPLLPSSSAQSSSSSFPLSQSSLASAS